uniref:Transposase n=1 Tax=Ascaris lumbricoides TaxID=6252 RepID=A0A0M3I5I1_ASCLU
MWCQHSELTSFQDCAGLDVTPRFDFDVQRKKHCAYDVRSRRIVGLLNTRCDVDISGRHTDKASKWS